MSKQRRERAGAAVWHDRPRPDEPFEDAIDKVLRARASRRGEE